MADTKTPDQAASPQSGPFRDATRELVRTIEAGRGNFRALMAATTAAYGGMEQRQQSIEDIFAGMVRANMRATKDMLRLISPLALMEQQQRFARECLDAVMTGGGTLLRAGGPMLAEAPALGQRPAGRPAQCVADVMSRITRVVGPNDTAQQAAQIMRQESAGALAVWEPGAIIGLITADDLAARLVAEARDPAGTKVREIMTPERRHLFADDGLNEAAMMMTEQNVSRLPVLSREQILVGIVSLSDLAAAKRGAPEGADSQTTKAIRILLVDDETDVLYSTGLFLGKAGFEVATATSGDQALALLAGGARFDAMVTDFAMPGFSGGQLVELAREMQPGLPAIVMTGFAEVNTGRIAETAAVLRKPIQRQQLIAAVQDVIALAARNNAGDVPAQSA